MCIPHIYPRPTTFFLQSFEVRYAFEKIQNNN
jgi:hypothetical protein